MMPTLLPRPESGGFTLIELLVVIAIVALIAIAVVPNLGRRPAGLARAGDVTAAIAALERARKAARDSGVPQQVDPEKLLPGSRITDAPFASNVSVVFYPDGSASGGSLSVNGRRVLTIDWLTGVPHV